MSSRNYTEGMFYYDPSFGYIVITAEQLGGQILYGRGPIVPYDPDSVTEQRYTANDMMRWREAIDVPDDWLDALAVPRRSNDRDEHTFAEPSTVYDIDIAPPRLKQWQAVLVVFVWLIIWLIWNSNK